MNDCIILGPDKPRKFKHDRLVISSENKLFIKYRILGWKIKESIGLGIINPEGIRHTYKHIDIEENIFDDET